MVAPPADRRTGGSGVEPEACRERAKNVFVGAPSQRFSGLFVFRTRTARNRVGNFDIRSGWLHTVKRHRPAGLRSVGPLANKPCDLGRGVDRAAIRRWGIRQVKNASANNSFRAPEPWRPRRVFGRRDKSVQPDWSMS